ncbi:MAG: tetratricopeptide repeat protein [Chloroflexi bacterium]|nr:tetratricopeptide repeat protein [Chloroflexota bacterium]MBI3169804.1 tetratricopeptide repeat protein [Chloroflexota bacterium]
MSQPTLPDFDSLWDYSHPEQTETKFLEILPQFPDGDPARLELLTQIARAQGLQREFSDAHLMLDEVEKQLSIDSSRARVRYLLERGRVLNSSGKPNEARPFFEQAMKMAQELNEDFYAVDAIHMLAIVADPASALDLNLRAIQMAESSGQERARGWLGSLYNNTGWSYHEMGDYESALKIFEKAETYFRSVGSADKTRIAKWTVARCLRSLKRVEEALSKQMALKAEYDTIGGSDGYVEEEIGECLLALNRGSEAKPYFAKAYELLSQDDWLVEKEPERMKRMKELSGIS